MCFFPSNNILHNSYVCALTLVLGVLLEKCLRFFVNLLSWTTPMSSPMIRARRSGLISSLTLMLPRSTFRYVLGLLAVCSNLVEHLVVYLFLICSSAVTFFAKISCESFSFRSAPSSPAATTSARAFLTEPLPRRPRPSHP